MAFLNDCLNYTTQLHRADILKDKGVALERAMLPDVIEDMAVS